MITQYFDLNMIPDSEPVVVHVNQYDTGTGRLVASLYNGETPYTPTGTAAIQGTKPDGIGFMYSATLSGNTVTADLKDQMSVVAGHVRCQIVISETSGTTGTFCFDLDVQESALPDDAEISESDYPIIEELIHEAQEAAATATQAETNAEASAEDSEAWAVGTRNGVPVPNTDPTYHNNSKYWAEHGGGGEGGHVIMDGDGNDMPARNTLQFKGMTVEDDAVHGITIVTGSEGGSTIKITTTESTLHGEDVTITDGTTTYTETFDNNGVAVFKGITITGNLTVTSTDGVDTAEAMIPVDYFGNYEKNITFFTAPITITTDSPLFFGKTVTVKDSHNVTVGTDTFTTPGSGNATATVDVPSTGVYTVSCAADDGGTDSDTVSVTSQTGASVFLHLWNNALVISTESSELASAQISITKEVSGQQVPVGVVSFPASGTLTATFNVHETGTYTASVSYSGDTYDDTHTVSAEGTTPYTIVTIPNGSTVTPTDDIQIWLSCAGITDKAYTTLNEVLADHETLYILMGNNNAVDYLVRSTTWVSGITSDETAMKYIGKWNYCSDELLDDSTWLSAINASAYFESILNTKVPNMTGYNTPSGQIYPDVTDSTYPAWKCFDGDESTTGRWYSTSGFVGKKVYYDFGTPIKISKFGLLIKSSVTMTYELIGSNDTTGAWTVLSTTPSLTTLTDWQYFDCSENDVAYRYIGLQIKAGTILSGGSGVIHEIQFYGRQDVTEGIDIYGAASDDMTVTGNGITLTITTDTSGHYIVPKTSLPNGTYTFTSIKAKDPTNLSNDYSKSVTVTDGTSEIYVMPDGYVLYWWGYQNNLQSLNTSNGWSAAESGYSFVAPTYNADHVLTKAGEDVSISGVGTASEIPSEYQSGTVVCIGLKTAGQTFGIRGGGRTAKTVAVSGKLPIVIDSTTIIKVTGTSGQYIPIAGQNGRNGKMYALYVTV